MHEYNSNKEVYEEMNLFPIILNIKVSSETKNRDNSHPIVDHGPQENG